MIGALCKLQMLRLKALRTLRKEVRPVEHFTVHVKTSKTVLVLEGQRLLRGFTLLQGGLRSNLQQSSCFILEYCHEHCRQEPPCPAEAVTLVCDQPPCFMFCMQVRVVSSLAPQPSAFTKHLLLASESLGLENSAGWHWEQSEGQEPA